ncbi:SDR family NAD(P)-dependent oxidoreductase [Candidatus Nomurabacteria bacterium]|nr:SDR family NAD(P)-dependent oxidoreductase [Candidatus Nomurabacteria bacterium]
MKATKTVLLLGATGGIGEAITKSLSITNTTLLLHGKSNEKLELLKAKLAGHGNQVHLLPADLSDKTELQLFTESLSKQVEKIDWIIFAAGFINEHEFEDKSPQTEVKTFMINAVAPTYIIKSQLGNLGEEGGIITISSTAALWGNPEFPIYASSKAALNTFTQIVAKLFGHTKKRALTVCPGATNTQMRERVAKDSETQQSPEIISSLVKEIIYCPEKYSNGDTVVVKNGNASKIKHTEPEPLH